MIVNDLEQGEYPPEVRQPEDVHTRSLESRAIKGAYLLVVFYGAAMSLRLVSSIVLSRLFMPQYFGLTALITTVIVGMNLFSHVGLQDSIVQHPRGDEPAFLNTAWTIQVIRGAGLFLLTFPLAWPIAYFYKEPQIVHLLPALGFGCFLAGISSPSLLSLGRHMGVGRLSALELLSQFVLFAVTVLCALVHPSIWDLVVGRLTSELVRTIASYRMLPELRPRFTWDKKCVRTLVHFGRWILAGTALTFLALQSDRLILAKLVSFRVLGVYGIAFSLSDIPRQIVLQFCSRVGFPFIARFSHLPRNEYRATLLKYRMLVLAVGGLMIVAVISTGDLFILHFYTKPYHAAAWMIGILAIGLWHTLLYSTVSPAILSLQKAHYNALGYLVYCISLYIALPLGFHFLGMVGAVIAVAIADLPVYFVNAFSAGREGISTFRQDALLTFLFFVALALALAAREISGLGSPFARIP
jgi:O-antigen/teichoic acid export membrane protein